MNKQKEQITISAHELNKFSYCPYQWYFEKIYGRKELRRRYQERNARLGLDDAIGSHFRSGECYHEKSYRNYRFRQKIKSIVLILLAALLIAGYLAVKYGMV